MSCFKAQRKIKLWIFQEIITEMEMLFTHKGNVKWIMKETGSDNPSHVIGIQKPIYKLISPMFNMEKNHFRIYYDTWVYDLELNDDSVRIVRS